MFKVKFGLMTGMFITLWVLENFRDGMAKKVILCIDKNGYSFKRVDKDVLLRKRGGVTSLFHKCISWKTDIKEQEITRSWWIGFTQI